MQQFFIEDINNPTLSKTQFHQVKNVLRMRKGDLVRLVDLKGEGIIAQFSDDSLRTFEMVQSLSFPTKSYHLKVVMSLIRNERLEWMIQKATEIGIDEIVLYKSDHGVVRDYKDKTDRKLERFNTIALEASEQSYRQYPLIIQKVIDKKELESEMTELNVYADLNVETHVTDLLTTNTKITAMIGPEGGFSDAERKHFSEIGFIPVSLGHNVLRAETAPIILGAFTSLIDKEMK